MTYEQNIQRLRSTSRFNTQQAQQFETNNANNISQWHRDRANKVIDGLSNFSKTLQEEKKRQIEFATQRGKKQFTEDRAVDLKKFIELKQMERDAKLDAIGKNRLKELTLRLEGLNAYPDADRIAKLSYHEQIGYTRAKLRNRMDSFPDTFNYRMQNSETPYQLNVGGGKTVTFTAKQIRNSNVNSYVLKEALVSMEIAKLKKEMGLDKFTPEILELVGVNKTIQDAKDAYLGKIRKQYTIEASMQTQAQAKVTYQQSSKSGIDVHHYLSTVNPTTDKKGVMLDNAGALNSFFAMKVADSIKAGGDLSELNRLRDEPIPELMLKELKLKPGKTFGEHWGPRFAAAEVSITDGLEKATDAVLKEQEVDINKLTIAFNKDVADKYKEGRSLTKREVNAWIDQYHAIGLGGKIPEIVKNYQTNSERLAEKDKAWANNQWLAFGKLTNNQLDGLHPLAAGEFREKADAYEKEIYETFNADDIIKGALNNTFADMGVKDREKSVAYQTAYTNAKRDYHKQFNEYKSFGVSNATANLWALKGPQGKEGETLLNAQGKPMFSGRLGVQTEIETNGENSKYTRAGLEVEDTIGDEMKRVRFAMNVKKELAESKEPWNLRKTKILGGDYGQKQLDAIKANIQRYGFNRGIAMSKESIQFYEAIMVGKNLKEGGWWGLIHDQLMLDDPKSGGLQRNQTVNSILPLWTRKVVTPDGEEEDVEDKDGVFEVSSAAINAADNKAPLLAYNYITDADNYYNKKSNGSIFDQPDQIPSYLGGTA